MSVGGGVLAFDKRYDYLENQFFPAASFEAGLDYQFNSVFGIRVSSQYRYLLKDGLDGISQGRYNDQQWNVNVGFTVKPNFF